MNSCFESCAACCCPNRSRADPSETVPVKQPLLQEQQMQPGPRGELLREGTKHITMLVLAGWRLPALDPKRVVNLG